MNHFEDSISGIWSITTTHCRLSIFSFSFIFFCLLTKKNLIFYILHRLFFTLTRNTGHYWMWKSYSTSVDQKVLASSHLPKDLKQIKPEKNCMAPLLRVEKLRYVLCIHRHTFIHFFQCYGGRYGFFAESLSSLFIYQRV